ncbi:MFS transporter small subunit [Actinomycetospora atypica]|uniref:Oxalate:formate antiporter n=1 Tax=Actinomycetospora atypica TaxID=1290095 RepID=A0ABV9YHU9_9PSEU
MTEATSGGGRTVLTVLAWLWVLVPFLYGVWQLVIKVPALF